LRKAHRHRFATGMDPDWEKAFKNKVIMGLA